ncbi:hypothetical protein [Klebsiella pneumoniae]|uniref:hypothetical protein n=1 Tax=Klebsiella pneumoniae TaxID=573 RepID=UPI00321ADDF5
MNAVYRFPGLTTAQETALTAVALNNPDATLVPWYHLKRWNNAALHQKIKRFIVSVAGSLIVLAAVKIRSDVNIVDRNKHPGIWAFNYSRFDHLLERISHF